MHQCSGVEMVKLKFIHFIAFGVECYDYLAGEEPSSDSTCTDNKWCMKVTAKNDVRLFDSVTSQ